MGPCHLIKNTIGQIFMGLPFWLRGDLHHGRIRKDQVLSPQSHRGSFPYNWVPLTQTGTGLREHVPLLIQDIELPAQHSVDVMLPLTQDDLNRSRHTPSLCLPRSLWAEP